MTKLIAKLKKYINTLTHPHVYVVALIEVSIGLALSIITIFLFFELSEEILEKEFALINEILINSIYSFRTDTLNEVMKVVTLFGNELIALFVAILSITFLIKNKRKEAISLTFVVVMGALLNYLLKYYFQIPRPTIDPLITEGFYSFPSGHSMTSFIFYSMVTYLTFLFTKNKIVRVTVLIVSALIILLVGFSRVYLGVHYPTDVIAGYLAGFWWFITAIVIIKSVSLIKIYRKENLIS